MQVQSNFLAKQKRYQRVRTAISQKQKSINQILHKHNISLSKLHILIVAYKQESTLELYGKEIGKEEYKLLNSYKICSKSGKLGPKRKQGDLQVPEGLYHIDRFNPASSYYLSLGINYPNKADKIKSNATKLGGDIFIHGECVTIGCLPMTNDKIKEIYLYAIYAKNNGQKQIPVYIFPFRLTENNNKNFLKRYNNNTKLRELWTNLKEGFEIFQKNKKALSYTIDKNGNYCIKK